MKNVKWAFIGRLVLSIAFAIMVIYGFVELIKTKFATYDTVVLKLLFWTGNPAQTLWNLLIIMGFFTFIFWTMWIIKRKATFWIWGVLYAIIGLLTLIFAAIEEQKNGTRLAIGIVVSLLLMLGSGFLIFVAYRMKPGDIIINNWKIWKQTKKDTPIDITPTATAKRQTKISDEDELGAEDNKLSIVVNED